MSDTPTPRCGVVGGPEAGRKVCELPKGHEGYHQQGHVRWLGYFPATAPSAPPASAPKGKRHHEEAAQVSNERSVERSELSSLRVRGAGEDPPPTNQAASARTVTRYRAMQGATGIFLHSDDGDVQANQPVVLYAEVAALLTALAESEQENARLKATARTFAAEVRNIANVRYGYEVLVTRIHALADQLDACAAEGTAK